MKRMQQVILLLAAMTLFLSYRQIHRQDNTEGITRAQTARILAWTVCDMNKNSSKSDEPLIDVDSRLWYADEISVVLANELMKKNGDMFYPNHYLTWQEASDIGNILGIHLSIPLFQKKKPIPLEKWLQYFDEWLAGQKMDITRQLRIEALPSTSSHLESWQVQTDQRIYNCEGLILEKYLGQTVTAYLYKDQLLMVSKADSRRTEVITATETADTDGRTPDETETYSENNTTKAETSDTSQTIRVCIMNDGFISEEHQSISMCSDEAWHLTFKDRTVQYPSGEIVEFTADDFAEDGDLAEITVENEGAVTVHSLNRSCGHPAYQGRLRIVRAGKKLYLINILPVEDYLKGVVPSEMPASYHSEALKAQAVCARSYALAALQHPKYDFADLNDSTSSQVYMNQATDERTDWAVQSTAGEVLTWQQQIATAKYFSTSCGSLSSDVDVWGYPDTTHELSYMTPRLETETPMSPELETEQAFMDFILHPESGKYIEEADPWFRWQTVLSLSNIRSNIAEMFSKRMAADPKRFTVLSSDGAVHAEDITQMEVVKRASSGLLQKIKFIGKNQELTVSGEYNIRCLLAPSEDVSVILQDKSTRNGMTLLPSGYFYPEAMTENGEITGYMLYGGGFGHGAGLSQNGASVLAEKGYDYKEILQYFFKDINITNVNTIE